MSKAPEMSEFHFALIADSPLIPKQRPLIDPLADWVSAILTSPLLAQYNLIPTVTAF